MSDPQPEPSVDLPTPIENLTESAEPPVAHAEPSQGIQVPDSIEDILNDDHPPTQRPPVASSSTDSDPESESQFFQCNICFDAVKQPVVTLCGHLFCWPCIYRWFEQSNSCPVCKAGASKDKLVPIYGRNSEGNITEDPRDSIPERPAAQRPEPMPQYNPFQGMFQHNFAGGGVSFSAGFFPLGFQMSWPSASDVPMTEQQQHQLFVSRMLLSLGFLVLMVLLIL